VERAVSNSVIEEIISTWLPITNDYQKCSFILPNGKYVKIQDHYEVYRALVVDRQYVQCIPDAEQLLSELGYVRYSYIGYMTLPDKKLNKEQYKTLENVLVEIARTRDEISVQIHSQPKFFINFSLDDIPNIIRKIQLYYSAGTLLP
jgi:hypothetical protein